MRRTTVLTLMAALLAPAAAFCQDSTATAGTLPGATLNVYAFPAAGQSAEQHVEDERSCYAWAVESSGVDPLAMAQQPPRQELKAPEAPPEVKQSGASAGSPGQLIGAIAYPKDHVPAISELTAGQLVARHRAREKRLSEMFLSSRVTNFKKAFSACLKAKSYIVEY